MCGWNWSGTTWICAGTPRTMAGWRIWGYRRTGSGNRTCWCTTVRMRDSTAPTRRTWWCATTDPVCTCRRGSSSRRARSTSRGSPSMTSAARWSSAAGPTTDSRFGSVTHPSKQGNQEVLNLLKKELVVVMLDRSNSSIYIIFTTYAYDFTILVFSFAALIWCEWDIYIILPSPRISYIKAGFTITRWNWRWYQQLRAQRRVGTTGWVSQRRPGATYLPLSTLYILRHPNSGSERAVSSPFFRQIKDDIKLRNYSAMLPVQCVCAGGGLPLSAGEETMVLKVLRTRCCSFAEFWPCGWFIAYFRVPNTHKDSHTHTRKKLQLSLSHYHLLTLFHSWAGFKLRTKVPNSIYSTEFLYII